MRPIEMLLGKQVGAVNVVFDREEIAEAIVECFNGSTRKETYFMTTLENGKAIQEWLDAGRPGMIQDSLPQLTVDEREQCLSGITPEEWNEMFGEEETE